MMTPTPTINLIDPADRPMFDGHDGRCRCGAVVPCCEGGCEEPSGHEYDCPECLARECGRPDPFDLACERRSD